MSICDRFHCLPSQALKEDADIIQLLKIMEIANPPGGGEDA